VHLGNTYRKNSITIFALCNYLSLNCNIIISLTTKVSTDAAKISILTIPDGLSDQEIDNRTEINFNLSDPSRTIQKGNNPDDEIINNSYSSLNKNNTALSTNNLDVSDNDYDSYKDIYSMLKEGRDTRSSGKRRKDCYQRTKFHTIELRSSFHCGWDLCQKFRRYKAYSRKTLEVLRGSKLQFMVQ